MTDVTRILNQIEQGDLSASENLLPLVYDELRKLAAANMSHERPDHTLQATALVHEAYLRLVDVDRAQHWNSRGHFFGAAASAMRRILVDTARRKKSTRRGGEARRVDAQLDQLPIPYEADELLNVDRELDRLKTENPVVFRLVELKYFAGFTLEEAAAELNVTVRTAHRYWAYAKAWLRKAIGENATPIKLFPK